MVRRECSERTELGYAEGQKRDTEIGISQLKPNLFDTDFQAL